MSIFYSTTNQYSKPCLHIIVNYCIPMSSHKCVVFSGYQPLRWAKSMSGQLSFAIPLTEPRPPQYVRGPWFFAIVNQWVQTQKFTTFSVDGPAKSPPNGCFWNPNKNMGCWPLFTTYQLTLDGWNPIWIMACLYHCWPPFSTGDLALAHPPYHNMPNCSPLSTVPGRFSGPSATLREVISVVSDRWVGVKWGPW